MKSWQVADEMRRDPALARAVEETRGVLEEVIGPTAGLVDARWSVNETKSGNKRFVLKISDWTWPKGVEAELADDELSSPAQLRRKLEEELAQSGS